ncbi:MAG: hypothetical protein O3C10_07275 [Chloroflexi bacterium]|nr:hypothetical protein [Chloroflexota bacterium]
MELADLAGMEGLRVAEAQAALRAGTVEITPLATRLQNVPSPRAPSRRTTVNWPGSIVTVDPVLSGTETLLRL